MTDSRQEASGDATVLDNGPPNPSAPHVATWATEQRDRAEANLVEHLASHVEHHLADRGDPDISHIHPSPWTPKSNVVLGVLSPTVLDADADHLASATDGQPQVDDDSGPASTGGQANATDSSALLNASERTTSIIGVDFAVTPTDSTSVEQLSTVTIDISIDSAIYVAEYATLEQHRADTAWADPTVADTTGSDAPNDPVGATDGGADDGPTGSTGQGGGRDTGRVNVLHNWRRIPIHIDQITLDVPVGGNHAVDPDTVTFAVRDAIDQQLAAHGVTTRHFAGRTQTLPASALDSQEAFDAAIAEAEDRSRWTYPLIHVDAFAQRAGNLVLVSVSLLNRTVLLRGQNDDALKPYVDLALYDTRMKVTPGPARAPTSTVTRQRFVLAPDDYRYGDDVSTTVGRGRACVAVPHTHNDGRDGVASTCVPRHTTAAVDPRTDHVPELRWDTLADPGASDQVLAGVADAMQIYLDEWDTWLATQPADVAKVSRADRDRFADEHRRFQLGRRAMRSDPRLRDAFLAANDVFARTNASRQYNTWRLFQLVYIITHLPALAAREHDDPSFRDELYQADVLWFPTGGGKTEAYMGLLVVAMLYDRLRGKDRGTTAWLKFPLRMLSVQQLARVLRVLHAAEEVRAEMVAQGKVAADSEPFMLGYLIGSGSTPNRLSKKNPAWWPGFERAKTLEEGKLDAGRLVSTCLEPGCGAEAVGLDVDEDNYRLVHVCRTCGTTLPISMTDEEVWRTMPSVLVGTVDRTAYMAFSGETTSLQHGPRHRCPTHGWYSFPRKGPTRNTVVCPSNGCVEPPAAAEAFYDPVPALLLQDELHLLRDELGAFDAHYQTLLAHLQSEAGTQLPSKVLAASATIEQFEDQVRQVYGRPARAFPAPGWTRIESFYTREQDRARRVFVGVLPNYRRQRDVAAVVTTELIAHCRALAADPDAARAACDDPTLIDDQIAQLLFDYEVTLTYVNNKAHGDYIADQVAELSERLADTTGQMVRFEPLTGEVSLDDLARAIDRVETDTPAMPVGDRLNALIGTRVVSHGVDLERLNLFVMTGLPPTVADYIQATARAGRTRVGLVVTVFDPYIRRERSTFSSFPSYHQFLDRMVEPVPVNRFARFVADRTLPGLISILLWDMARARLTPNAPVTGIMFADDFLKWWNADGPTIRAELGRRVEASIREVVPGINEKSLEDELVDRAIRELERHLLRMNRPDCTWTNQLLDPPGVLRSFRDIDAPVDFGAVASSYAPYMALTGTPRTTAGGNEHAAPEEDTEGTP